MKGLEKSWYLRKKQPDWLKYEGFIFSELVVGSNEQDRKWAWFQIENLFHDQNKLSHYLQYVFDGSCHKNLAGNTEQPSTNWMKITQPRKNWLYARLTFSESV